MLTSHSAHLQPETNGVSSSNGNGYVGKNPLAGLVPRKVTVDQAKAIMVSHSEATTRFTYCDC